MSVPKPSTLPTWDSGSVNLTPPTGGHQASGWAVSEVPTSTEMNGWQKNVGDWGSFLNSFFSNGGTVVGRTDLGNDAEGSLTPLAAMRDWSGNMRSLVDHNGYRMGQTSEIDETWNVSPIQFRYPLTAGLPQSGTWTNFGNWSNTVNGTIYFGLGVGLIPDGALITNIIFNYNRTTGTDSQTFSLVSSASGSNTTLASKTISSGTGAASTDLATSPGAGTLPRQLNMLSHDYQIAISSTVTTSFNLYSIQIIYVMPPPGWGWNGATTNTNATVGDKLVSVDPQSGLNQRSVQLVGAALGGVAGGSVLSPGGMPSQNPNWETFLDLNCAYVLEFMVKTGTITDGSAHRLFALGIQNNNAGALNRFVQFYTDNTFANWQVQVVGSSTANNDTGVAVAASTVYRMRLEIFGSAVSSAGAGNFRIRGFINGTKVVDVVSTTLPAADMVRPYFQCGTNGTTGGPYDFTLGRLRRAWNHLLAGDNL